MAGRVQEPAHHEDLAQGRVPALGRDAMHVVRAVLDPARVHEPPRDDGSPEDHVIERRADLGRAESQGDQSDSLAGEGAEDAMGVPLFIVSLTSIHWREAWKYGERAFRYCQHDCGHAIAALSLSAALPGEPFFMRTRSHSFGTGQPPFHPTEISIETLQSRMMASAG